MDASRVIVYSRKDEFVCELAPADVFERERTEELNGKHTMSITTTRVLEHGQRVLTRDATGKWREHVVYSVDEAHQSGDRPIGTYGLVWSLQFDLSGVTCDTMPGTQTQGGVAPGTALASLLTHTSRWAVGTVTATTYGAASFYNLQAWEALGVFAETWDAEIDAQITVSDSGAVTRAVAALSHLGSVDAVRRFDYARDMAGIRRRIAQSVVYAQIVPLGKGEEVVDPQTGEVTGYGRRITIESVNSGKRYLRNTDVANAMRLPDGSGGWEYPELIVVNDEMTTPADLLAWAQSVLEDYTVPKVTYTADVVQLAAAGMDPHGLALGDTVQCVDKGFGGGGLRVTGRVTKLVVNELDPAADTKVTIGEAVEDVSSYFQAINQRLASAQSRLEVLGAGATSTAEYLSNIISNLNDEINATGGYWYITEGQGVRTYDTAVSDPLVGAEASAVTEMRGGTLRFANSRTAQGAWDWKTILVSGHIATELITSGQITSGFIGSPSGNYWNLDTGQMNMLSTATIGGYTAGTIVNTANGAASAAASATTTANSALDKANAEVGGTNLLLDTDAGSLTKVAATANRYWSKKTASGVTTSIQSLSTTARPVGGVTKAAQLAFNASQTANYAAICFYSGKAVKLINNQKYTVSCWARTTTGSGQIWFQYGQTAYKASKKLATSTTWKRYSFTFTFKQTDVGGTNGARVYFYGQPKTAATCTLQICGMKLEVGGKATDWSPAPEDTSHSVAAGVEEAETFTAAQRALLDESFNQEKVFNRLVTKRNGQKAQGLILDSNGNLYINASFINAGTVNAGIIKAGILADKKSKNFWNMETGVLNTKEATLEDCKVSGSFSSGTTTKVQIARKAKDGTIKFTKGNAETLTIDGALKFTDGNYGARMTFPKYLILRGPDIAVDDSVSGTGIVGATFTLQVLIPTVTGGSQSSKSGGFSKLTPSGWRPSGPTWRVLKLRFINGICVGAALDATK